MTLCGIIWVQICETSRFKTENITGLCLAHQAAGVPFPAGQQIKTMI
jgi:hypothetical protein